MNQSAALSGCNISRLELKNTRRIVIKMGTSVVSTNGEPALGRIASLVEQICMLKRQRKEIILVTSGAVGIGRKTLNRQMLLSASLRTHVQGSQASLFSLEKKKGAMAATGQIGLMSLYETLFSLYEVVCSQVLVTASDFKTSQNRVNMRETLLNLLELDVIPIINENDAVSAALDGTIFNDNDSLAALVTGEIQADVLLLLTDVEGLYDKPPNEPDAKIISIFHRSCIESVQFGAKSNVGRGGMESKIHSAQSAIAKGAKAVVIASGFKYGIISSIMQGDNIGTLFVTDPDALFAGKRHTNSFSATDMAVKARNACHALQALSSETRSRILFRIANELEKQKNDILAANAQDLNTAKDTSLDESLFARLKLTNEKLDVLAEGIKSIAQAEEPIGQVLSVTELASGLILRQETASIGVLLVIFESRPDSLPQIAALAIRSGNGLLLKGGKEAAQSNAFLHQLIVKCIESETNGQVSRELIGLVTSRDEIKDLLALDTVIDLCIPRGSGSMVSYIQKHTRIPVLGHAEGICHMYIHAQANLNKAQSLAIDAKTDYPAACNALETLLIDSSFIETRSEDLLSLLRALQNVGVTLHLGPRAKQILLPLVVDNVSTPVKTTTNLSKEYGTKDITIEIVDNVEQAIQHINQYSSGHTECIVTENQEIAHEFQRRVDSACVFHNASTRFADGYRFGLGAEVGISTGRIHARGPVGVEGLLTTKWKLTSEAGHLVAQFSKGKHGEAAEMQYTHKKLAVIAQDAVSARPKSSRL